MEEALHDLQVVDIGEDLAQSGEVAHVTGSEEVQSVLVERTGEGIGTVLAELYVCEEGAIEVFERGLHVDVHEGRRGSKGASHHLEGNQLGIAAERHAFSVCVCAGILQDELDGSVESRRKRIYH